MQEVVLSEYKKIADPNYNPQWGGDKTQIYSMVFCYTPNGNFVVKGMHAEVMDYVRKTYPKVFCTQIYFRGKRGICGGGIWEIFSNGDRVASGYLSRKEVPNKVDRYGAKRGRKYYKISSYGLETELSFRRLPKKWVPEFDKLVDEFENKKQQKLIKVWH